ncbi:MAG: DUF937 domain-containing protein [Candidatus Thiodiazotropha sp. (ex Monitilora ramsayi)]|nr:DUF937 domain-containing protein [Candidatus Thiodiazotropha sp. (ex Monitilora ramsayi)]
MNILDMMLSGQNGNQVQQLARNFGIGEGQAQAVLTKMVPALTQGVKKNIASESGLDGLLRALQNGGHQKYVDQPESLTDSQATVDGNGILGHILGSKDVSRALADRASDTTGLGSDMLKKMLPVVASMMMGSLSKQASLGGLSEQRAASSADMPGMLAGLLDADKDGSVVDDLLGMAGKFFR